VVHVGVVVQRADAPRAQPRGERLGVAARQAVDDAAGRRREVALDPRRDLRLSARTAAAAAPCTTAPCTAAAPRAAARCTAATRRAAMTVLLARFWDDLVKQVGAVDARPKGGRAAAHVDAEQRGHLARDGGRGRGRAREQGDARERLLEQAEAAVVGAKGVRRLAGAVRLVDGHARQAPALVQPLQLPQQALAADGALGRDE